MSAHSDPFRLHLFDALDSTQSEAKRGAYGADDVIVARRQTGAYGRRGRAWLANEGNLFFTHLQAMPHPAMLGWIPYAVGLALYDAVAPYLEQQDAIRLKWPNDVLLQGRKMSGILIEVQDDLLLIGIGVNIAVCPETDQPVTCLADHARAPVSPEQLLRHYLAAYAVWARRGLETGFIAMRPIWLERAAFLGETITARLADGSTRSGIFQTLDEQGGLVLSAENAHHIITSADIFLTQ